ncbi:MAG: arginine--tRNA ligase, partial [Polyangiaceae bacterium]|nr:arginine--tRNA ligase [Polyangiaceae bacterium]
MVLTTRVESEIRIALLQLAEEGLVPSETAATSVFMVERPKKAEHGHFATNVALTLSKLAKKDPRSLAELIRQKLLTSRMIASAEMAGPGFLNLRLKPEAFHECLLSIAEDPKNYGRKPAGSGDRIHLEFVSANPTGPITVAAGRNAILGDSIGRVLEAAGHRVTREYYVNDFGNQLKMFYESVKAIAEDRPLPEDGYQGEYVREIATYLKATQPALISGDPIELGRVCVTLMLRGIPGSKTLPGIKRSLRDVGVEHDVWFSEESLHRWGAVREVLASLEAGGWLVRKEGALFFVNKATEEKDQDKDRVVQKTDGSTTYFASDIAYHEDKINRGYDHLIAILGADHHGYVARIRNALEALGYDKNKYEAILYQLVFIYRNGELVRMGKRAGNFVTLEEVAEEVDARSGRKGAGRDAMRFFFLSRSPNVQVDFDLDLATKKSLDNPVFYVQ